jgi:hypothetical protein
LKTTLNYYKPNEDGSPPKLAYSDRPKTYIQPIEAHKVIIRDVTGYEKPARERLDFHALHLPGPEG